MNAEQINAALSEKLKKSALYTRRIIYAVRPSDTLAIDTYIFA